MKVAILVTKREKLTFIDFHHDVVIGTECQMLLANLKNDLPSIKMSLLNLSLLVIKLKQFQFSFTLKITFLIN